MIPVNDQDRSSISISDNRTDHWRILCLHDIPHESPSRNTIVRDSAAQLRRSVRYLRRRCARGRRRKFLARVRACVICGVVSKGGAITPEVAAGRRCRGNAPSKAYQQHRSVVEAGTAGARLSEERESQQQVTIISRVDDQQHKHHMFVCGICHITDTTSLRDESFERYR